MQKVTNSYSVVGSEWSVRRIISSTMSMLNNVDESVSTRRLVKGRILPKATAPTAAAEETST